MKYNQLFIAIIFFSTLWLAGCSNGAVTESQTKEESFPPSMEGVIRVNETEYELESGSYKWERKIGVETQVDQTDHASPNQMATTLNAVTLGPNQKVDIKIEENPQITVFLWNENGREKEINHTANQITVPSNKGRYVYEVLAKWSSGEVSYTFVIEIK